jgi:hypothetical protein
MTATQWLHGATAPAYRRWYTDRTRDRIIDRYAWELDRLNLRAEAEQRMPAGPAPIRTFPVPIEPPAWPTREGWHPAVLQHARDVAHALGIDLPRCMERTPWGSLRRGPHNVSDRVRLWHAMRQTPARGGTIPSFPEIAKVFGLNHSTVVTAVVKYRKRKAQP